MAKVAQPEKRRPGRPPSYVFDKPDEQLTDLERRLKLSVIKRRLRQNRSYHRRKMLQAAAAHPPKPGDAHDTAPVPSPASLPSQASQPAQPAQPAQPLLHAIPAHEHHVGGPAPVPGAALVPGAPAVADGVPGGAAAATAFAPGYPPAFPPVAPALEFPALVVDAPMHFPPGDAHGDGGARVLPSPPLHFDGPLGAASPSPFAMGTAAFAAEEPFGGAGRAARVEDLPDGGVAVDAVGAVGAVGAVDAVVPGATEQESAIMDELLEMETGASIVSSSVMLRMGASEVVRNLSSMTPEARGGAHALSFFPACFDACAAAAMLGRNVQALVTLISTNVLVVSSSGTKPRFSVNPLVKHMLPAIRAQDEVRRRRLKQKAAITAQVDAGAALIMGAGDPTAAPPSVIDPSRSLDASGLDFGAGGMSGMGGIGGMDTGAGGMSEWDLFGDAGEMATRDPTIAAEAFGFVEKDDESSSSSSSSDPALPSNSTLRSRFVAHFGQILGALSDNPGLFRNGTDRLRAMKMYDTDRENIMHAMRLAESMGTKVHIDFLRKSAQVMRFCTDAKSRVGFFQSALSSAPDLSTSVARPSGLFDDVGGARVDITDSFMGATAPTAVSPYLSFDSPTMPGSDGEEFVPTPHDLEKSSLSWLEEFGAGFCPELAARASSDAKKIVAKAEDECRLWKNHARVHLALGEAFCDMLDLEKAEAPLQKARDLMDAHSRRSEVHTEALFLGLPNLLLAEIKASKGEVDEAKQLLFYALSMLSQAGLSESTFTVNAMNTLVGVHLMKSNFEEAMWTSLRMVDVLANLGGGSYKGMPIYADALGTLATVHLSLSQPHESERIFGEALETVNSWTCKQDWDKTAPFEHCQDLDIWLLEGLARACRDQGKIVQADERMYEADRKRVQRGLVEGESNSSGSESSGAGRLNGSSQGYLVDESTGMGSFGSGNGSPGAQFAGVYKAEPFLASGAQLNEKACFPQQGAVRPRVGSTLSVRNSRPYMRHIY